MDISHVHQYQKIRAHFPFTRMFRGARAGHSKLEAWDNKGKKEKEIRSVLNLGYCRTQVKFIYFIKLCSYTT